MYTRILVFTVFLKNRNIISKIKRSKVTDYAALKYDNGIVYMAYHYHAKLLVSSMVALTILNTNNFA